MNDLKEFFQNHRNLLTPEDLARLRSPKIHPVQVNWEKLAQEYPNLSGPHGTFRHARGEIHNRASFASLFDDKYAMRYPCAEEISPLTQVVLKAMDQAECDLSRYYYQFSFSKYSVIPSQPRSRHIDTAACLTPGLASIFMASTKDVRVTLSNICSTATFNPFALQGNNTEVQDAGLFYKCAAAYSSICLQNEQVGTPEAEKHFDDDIIRGYFPTEPDKGLSFANSVRQAVKEIMGDPQNYDLHEDSSPVPFAITSFHAPTCEFTQPSDPQSQTRHFVLFSIYPRS